MLIRGGHIVDPASGTDQAADIRIRGERIDRIGQGLLPLPGEEVLEASGLTVSPGLVDAHVHFRDPGQTWKEDMFTGAGAAAAGGFTRVVCMANTVPPVDEPDILKENVAKGEQTPIHVYHAAAVTKGLKGRELTDMRALKEAGDRKSVV